MILNQFIKDSYAPIPYCLASDASQSELWLILDAMQNDFLVHTDKAKEKPPRYYVDFIFVFDWCAQIRPTGKEPSWLHGPMGGTKM